MGITSRITFLFATLVATVYSFESPYLLELEQDLQEITKSATKTKLNIDYQPYILSVWSSEKLMSMGCLTLKDALMILPNVDISVDNIYNQTTIFRGSNPFAYGQSKLFIDGILVNDRTFQSYSPYLDVPLEMIKRIEVIRGPGAFEADEGGYAGSIRVVTHTEDDGRQGGRAFAGFGSYNSKSFGVSYNAKLADWKLHTEIFGYSNSVKIPTNGKDGLVYSQLNSSLASIGQAPINLNTKAFGFIATNGGFSLATRVIDYELGSAYGNFFSLPNIDSKQYGKPWYMELKYSRDISRDLNVEIKSGYMEDGWNSQSRLLPSGSTLPAINPGNILFPNGYWGNLFIKQRAYYTGTTFRYDGFNSHSIIVGMKYVNEKNIALKSMTTDRTYAGISSGNMVDYTYTAPFFDSDAKRVTVKSYVSDTYEISQSLALSVGCSSDKATDLSVQNDYRVGLVYQPNSYDIYKFMTNSSYRAPSWQEMYTKNNPVRNGNPELEAEKVNSYEVQYIKKLSMADSIGVNLFYLENSNQIALIPEVGGYKFQNSGDATTYGGELELKKNVTPDDFIYFAYSYSKGIIHGGLSDRQNMPGAAENMLKSSWVRDWGRGVSTGVIATYVGQKSRLKVPDESSLNDNRGKLPAYTTIDFVFSYYPSKSDWGVQFGVKNLADSTVLYPSPAKTYDGDYQIASRLFFVKLSSRF